MEDVFKEQIVKKIPSSKDNLKRAGIIILAIVVSFIAMSLVPGFSFFVIAGAGFGAYYLTSNMNQEYEYIFTNGELDIDVIYNKTRRKRMYSGMVKDFEIMAHVEDKAHVGDFNSANETKDFSSGKVNENTYAFLVSYKGKRLKVIFEPNEVLFKAISTTLPPRKLFKKQ